MSLDRAIEATPEAAPLKVGFGGWGTGLTLLAVWLLLIAATGLYRPDFLSHQTVLVVAFTMSIVGVLAIAQGIVAISGSFIDLSQPAGLILSSLVAVRLSEAGLPLAAVIVGAVIAGMLWGAFNAAIIVVAGQVTFSAMACR